MNDPPLLINKHMGHLQPHTDIQINTSEGAVNYIYILDKLMQLSFKAIYM